MTCDFGTIRISQEKGKYTHRAVDLTNQPKSVVWAAQSGIVKIKDRYAMTGNTVVIDHGWGIITIVPKEKGVCLLPVALHQIPKKVE